jgi:DHA1 family putative efflux transporter-like MFS transporter
MRIRILILALGTFAIGTDGFVIAVAPESSSILLSLNGSVIYLGIGAGSAVGGLILHFASLTALGWVSGGLALAAHEPVETLPRSRK